VQHLSIWDAIAVAPDVTDRVVEYVDHLHEHFVDPAVVVGGRYLAPTAPGTSAEMRRQSVLDHRFPDGPVWRDR
jgi:L-fuconate dehydratase